MSWIKINVTLPRSPKILLLGQYLGISRHEALGLAVEWLTWLDGVSSDGETGLTVEQVDELFPCHAKSVTGCHATFAQALLAVGWAGVNEHGELYAIKYTEHNGDSAKKRAQASKRKGKQRAKECHAKSVTECHAKSVTREEKNISNNICIPKEPINTVCGVADVPPRLSGKPKPESAEEVRRFMAGQAVCGLKGEELEACANGFFDDMEACGWTVRNGNPLFDWHAAARKYLTTWQRNLGRGSKGSEGVVYRSQKKQNYDL